MLCLFCLIIKLLPPISCSRYCALLPSLLLVSLPMSLCPCLSIRLVGVRPLSLVDRDTQPPEPAACWSVGLRWMRHFHYSRRIQCQSSHRCRERCHRWVPRHGANCCPCREHRPSLQVLGEVEDAHICLRFRWDFQGQEYGRVLCGQAPAEVTLTCSAQPSSSIHPLARPSLYLPFIPSTCRCDTPRQLDRSM